MSRAHRFGGNRGREAEGSLPMCSLGTENPPGSGWVCVRMRAEGKLLMMTHRPVGHVGRSHRSRGSGHYFGAVAACASSPCLESAHIQKALSGPQPRHSFAPCGHPSGKRLRLDAREKMHHLTVSNGGSARRRFYRSRSSFTRARRVAYPPVGLVCYD